MEVSLPTGSQQTIETVRVLHETVLALRTALDSSRKELCDLQSRVRNRDCNEVGGSVSDQKTFVEYGTRQLNERPMLTVGHPMENSVSKVDGNDKGEEHSEDDDVFETGGEGGRRQSEHEGKQDSEGESEDIDDIELVFTTGETDPRTISEAMVPIREEGSHSHQACQTSYKGHSHRKTLMHTVIVETDISKCGVVDDAESLLSSRRNTLPNPLPYRPIIHRDILAATRITPRSRGSPCRTLPVPVRPVVADTVPSKQESGAQTDITALPAQWKSETYLAHKISYNLTTLPSKFTLPVPRVNHIPLSDKTREARRVLLSDINFTSMVPELSRSADHLHQEEDSVQGLCKNYPGAFEYMKSFDVGRDGRSPRADRCCDFGRHGSRSSWGSHYGSRCQASNTSITPFVCEPEPRRRHSWRPVTTPCCHVRHVWSSVPSSPTRCPLAHPTMYSGEGVKGRKGRSKVSFHCSSSMHPGQSLPDLRADTESGESTDSLVDEAEEYLRRSIDSMLIARGRRLGRRHSDPDQACGFQPPKSAQPFLPKSPRDLKQDYLVKVITMDSRVVVGRVRYSGPVVGHPEAHVGVELPDDSGFSDGTFLGHKYFDCNDNHGTFVPFKKVVIAWTT